MPACGAVPKWGHHHSGIMRGLLTSRNFLNPPPFTLDGICGQPTTYPRMEDSLLRRRSSTSKSTNRHTHSAFLAPLPEQHSPVDSTPKGEGNILTFLVGPRMRHFECVLHLQWLSCPRNGAFCCKCHPYIPSIAPSILCDTLRFTQSQPWMLVAYVPYVYVCFKRSEGTIVVAKIQRP